MMDATDRWPAVQAARAWVLERSTPGPGSTVLDVGSGPGTFGAVVGATGAVVVDVDRAAAMVSELRRRRTGALAARADVTALPVRDAAADLVHVERVLQWSDDPEAGLAELRRVVAPGGRLAITDTDWGTFAVDVPDTDGVARWSAAALRWVPHPTLARRIPRRLHELGASEVAVRTDAVAIGSWDPDDPAQLHGPPGLPVRTIVDAARPDDRPAVLDDLEALAEQARGGRFFATLTLISTLARF